MMSFGFISTRKMLNMGCLTMGQAMIYDFSILILPYLLTFLASFFCVWGLKSYFNHQGLVDIPEDRKNHKLPTPRGGGLGIIAAMAIGITLLKPDYGIDQTIFDSLYFGAAVLAGISFLDDLKSQPAVLRLLLQIAVTGYSTAALYHIHGPLVPSGLPILIEFCLVWAAWVWFINLTNFMDGIDGISVIEMISILVGITILWITGFVPATASIPISLLLVAALLGFFYWNRPVAKIFLGDVGSVTLGYFVGGLLLLVAYKTHPLILFILPSYYLLDSTITLVKRMIKKEKFWKPHSSHFYQTAFRSGLSVTRILFSLCITNLGLIALALLGLTYKKYIWFCALIAFILVLLLLQYFSRKHQGDVPL